jgi:hypothetical protein
MSHILPASNATRWDALPCAERERLAIKYTRRTQQKVWTYGLMTLEYERLCKRNKARVKLILASVDHDAEKEKQ